MKIGSRFVSAMAIAVGFLSQTEAAHAEFIGYLALTQGDTTCYNAGVNEPSPIAISSSCIGHKPWGDGTLSYEGELRARADYSGLGAYVEWSQSVNASISGSTQTVAAGARMGDTLIISGGSGAGTMGLPIELTGTDGAFGGATAYGSLTAGGAGYFVTTGGPVSYVEGPGLYTYEIPFVFGVPVSIGLELIATVFGIGTSGGDSSGGISDFFGSADFLPFIVYDSNGGIVAGATVFSTSGHEYPVGALDVPEPSTLALFGAGLAALAMLRRRRKSRDSA